MSDRRRQAERVPGQGRERRGRRDERGAGRDRRQARAVAGAGDGGTADAGGARAADRDSRALHARVAERAGAAAATSPTTARRRQATTSSPSKPSRSRTRQPGVRARPVPGGGDVDGEAKIGANFRTGGGSSGAQHPCLFEGTERFFRSGYIGNLMPAWMPALDGVQAQARARRQGRGRRLRRRRLDDHHGEGVPEVEVHRVRLARRSRSSSRASARRTPASPTA